MNKSISCLLVLAACSHLRPAPISSEEKLVSVRSAVMQAQASYLKGCVDAMRELKVPVAFPGCRDRARLHGQELEQFMGDDL